MRLFGGAILFPVVGAGDLDRLTPVPLWKDSVAGILPDLKIASERAKTFSASWKLLKKKEI
jgi:hypothetical protein